MKILKFAKNNVFLLFTLFLLAFIPLYPKLPLVDITNTWVYIRIEDVLVALTWITFFILFWRKKATLKTPLTYPILIFWAVGVLATIHGVIFLFPKISGLFPHLALLNFLRRVEYLSVFFLAFNAMKNKKFVTPLIFTLAITMIGVFIYGVGQKFLAFPAFLTMNEEFAKGIPLRLSQAARIPSTFGGHYDLAAYLTLLIPIMGAMVFGFKSWYAKIFFLLTSVSGLILLLMTASRVSYGVYLVSIVFLLVLQKGKKFIIPVVILSLLLMRSFDGISQRFASTFQQVDLAVDSRTGKAIGVISQGGQDTGKIVIEDKESTGESLPQGSKYINFPSTSGKQFESEILFKKLGSNGQEGMIISKTGTIIVKKAFAYDVSFTTRFQGEWPRAIEALQRNLLLGSGYSSINLATDNNYLRMLGETGILGFGAFIMIFVIATIYAWRVLPSITDRKTRSLVYGVMAGVLALSLNAVLIDVFEASKVAFVLWLIMGSTLGLVHLYQEKAVNYGKELLRIITSIPVLVAGIAISGSIIFWSMISNYFVGDDFTWLRWAADCSSLVSQGGPKVCGSLIETILSFFTHSQGFFYRPGTKTFFYLMYPLFELFPTPYHVVSLMLHLASTSLLFFIFKKILGSKLWAFAGALLFMVLSVHAESIYWVSVTGHMITAVLILLALLAYMYWMETKNHLLFILAWISVLVSTFFHEYGAMGPLILIAYDIFNSQKITFKNVLKRWHYLALLAPIVIYAVLRSNASSFVTGGDYSYSLTNLPFNFAGNLAGYFFATIIGPVFNPIYTAIRIYANSHIPVAVLAMVAILIGALSLFLRAKNVREHLYDKQIVFALTFFVIGLIPFLGLGNLSDRYVYLASAGLVLAMIIILKKTLNTKRRNVVVGAVVLGIIYGFTQIFQLFSINSDWKQAGRTSNNALVALSYAYANTGALSSKPVFYFVNVPIKYGDAWVFPVGLQDALWFSFQNTPLVIVQTQDEASAMEHAKNDTENVHVFKFESNGDLLELKIPVIPAAIKSGLTPTPKTSVKSKTSVK